MNDFLMELAYMVIIVAIPIGLIYLWDRRTPEAPWLAEFRRQQAEAKAREFAEYKRIHYRE